MGKNFIKMLPNKEKKIFQILVCYSLKHNLELSWKTSNRSSLKLKVNQNPPSDKLMLKAFGQMKKLPWGKSKLTEYYWHIAIA